MHKFNEADASLQKYIYVGAQIHFLGSGNGARKFVDMLDSPENKFSESPDMIAKKGNDVIAIEHFSVDSSKNTRKGSNDSRELDRIEKKLASLRSKATDNPTIYHDTIKGERSYDNLLINTFKIFDNHYKKIPNYKKNMNTNKIIDSSTNLKTMFFIDDVSTLGANVQTDKGAMPILLPFSYEFLSFLKLHKDVDYVLACSYGFGGKQVWFIDNAEIDEYFNHIVDYKNMRFLDMEPFVLSAIITVPKNFKLAKENQ